MIKCVFYGRNNENVIVGRHKRSAINKKYLEHFQIIYGREMADLLKLSEEVDSLERDLMSARGHSRRKRESVDHIGNVISVCLIVLHIYLSVNIY